MPQSATTSRSGAPQWQDPEARRWAQHGVARWVSRAGISSLARCHGQGSGAAPARGTRAARTLTQR
jgi:hypothetical protein